MFQLVLHLSINTSDFWMITLHNRDTYLPGMHKVFGSTYIFTIPIMDNKTKRNQHGVFTLSSTKTHYMDLGGVKACEKTPTQTMEACIAGYVQTKVGCRLMPITTKLTTSYITLFYLSAIPGSIR